MTDHAPPQGRCPACHNTVPLYVMLATSTLHIAIHAPDGSRDTDCVGRPAAGGDWCQGSGLSAVRGKRG